MKRDLFDDLKKDVEIIFVSWGIDIDFNDDDEMADFVYMDLRDHLHLEVEDIHTIITYNYLLQMKASNFKHIDFIVEDKINETL
jgi:hypothetical protein